AFFFSSRRRHTISKRDWSSDVCSSDLVTIAGVAGVVYVLGSLAHVGRAGLVQAWLPFSVAAHHRIIGSDPNAAFPAQAIVHDVRSEERRVGKQSRARWRSYRDRYRRPW